MVPSFNAAVGSSIKVADGTYVNLQWPEPETLDIFTIAKVLSKICRYGGHCPGFYSVAEHCVLALELAFTDMRTRSELGAVLMHDAAEAYIGDMVAPLKRLMPGYQEIEKRFERIIRIRFNVDLAKHDGVVKEYDRIMLKAEKQAFWPDDTCTWSELTNVPQRDARIQQWTPQIAEAEFLRRASWVGLITDSQLANFNAGTHTLLKPEDCQCNGTRHCNICDGGLAYCTVCKGGEIELDQLCCEQRKMLAEDAGEVERTS